MMVNASNDTGFMNHYCYVNLVLSQQVDMVHSEDLVGVGIARFSQVFARWGAAIRNSGRIQMGPLPWEPESAPLALRGAGASLGDCSRRGGSEKFHQPLKAAKPLSR